MKKNISKFFAIILFWFFLLRRYVQVQIRIYWRWSSKRLRISLSELHVTCWDNTNCLTVFNEKLGILEHPETDPPGNPPVINVAIDPLYTGIEVQRNWKDVFYGGGDIILCNEPPPSGSGGGRVAFSAARSSAAPPIFDRPKSSAVSLNLNNIAFFDLDDSVSEPAQFLSISLFRGNYKELYSSYSAIDIDNADHNQAHNCGQVDKDDDDADCKSRMVDHSFKSCPFIHSFTVDSYLGHFVTIVKTRYTDRVLRFAYRDSEYFEKIVQFVL